jgi:hypothetical protein
MRDGLIKNEGNSYKLKLPYNWSGSFDDLVSALKGDGLGVDILLDLNGFVNPDEMTTLSRETMLNDNAVDAIGNLPDNPNLSDAFINIAAYAKSSTVNECVVLTEGTEYTFDDLVLFAYVYAIGGGGAGGNNTQPSGTAVNGAGGGGGYVSFGVIDFANTSSRTINYIVGSGGVYNTTAAATGGSGGVTTVSGVIELTAAGGSGGAGGSGNNSSAGGSGGSGGGGGRGGSNGTGDRFSGNAYSLLAFGKIGGNAGAASGTGVSSGYGGGAGIFGDGGNGSATGATTNQYSGGGGGGFGNGGCFATNTLPGAGAGGAGGQAGGSGCVVLHLIKKVGNTE